MRVAAALMIVTLSAISAPSALAAERLQVPQLPGWKVVSSVSDAAGEATDLVPQAETAETWSRRVTIQAFRGIPMTVPTFLDQVVEKTKAVCDEAAAGTVSLGTVSGHPAGSRTVACGRYKGDGKGNFTLYYAIRGREAFYVVSRAWRGSPFAAGTNPVAAAELADWVAYVDALQVCEPGRTCGNS